MSGRWSKTATRNLNVPNAQPLGVPWMLKEWIEPAKTSTT